ncbi:hypothetical protein K2Q16_03125 [Patescibacteria group bacterium]|nr:hypothetical protein [Patescibacteria group bacterium]
MYNKKRIVHGDLKMFNNIARLLAVLCLIVGLAAGHRFITLTPNIDLAVETLQNPEADTSGNYFGYLSTSRQLMRLVYAQRLLSHDELLSYVRGFQGARNAREVLRVQDGLLHRLAEAKVDYSDILYANGVIDYPNYVHLKQNLQRAN